MMDEAAEPSPPSESAQDDTAALLLRAMPVRGRCYVLTFSPRHDLTLADMAATDILPVVDAWTRAYARLMDPSHPLQPQAVAALAFIPGSPHSEVALPRGQLRYMQIFENKGAAMGCSNPHPHCQIWASSSLPEEPGKELAQMGKYHAENGRHMLGDYVKLEIEKGVRVVWQNDSFLVVCPWWAVWPFEVLVISKRHVRALVELTDRERLEFAEAIQEVTRRYDNLFETSFPYSKCLSSKLLLLPLNWDVDLIKVRAFTRPRCSAARRRPRPAGSTCTSTRPCSGPRRSASSWWATN